MNLFGYNRFEKKIERKESLLYKYSDSDDVDLFLEKAYYWRTKDGRIWTHRDPSDPKSERVPYVPKGPKAEQKKSEVAGQFKREIKVKQSELNWLLGNMKTKNNPLGLDAEKPTDAKLISRAMKRWNVAKKDPDFKGPKSIEEFKSFKDMAKAMKEYAKSGQLRRFLDAKKKPSAEEDKVAAEEYASAHARVYDQDRADAKAEDKVRSKQVADESREVKRQKAAAEKKVAAEESAVRQQKKAAEKKVAAEERAVQQQKTAAEKKVESQVSREEAEDAKAKESARSAAKKHPDLFPEAAAMLEDPSVPEKYKKTIMAGLSNAAAHIRRYATEVVNSIMSPASYEGGARAAAESEKPSTLASRAAMEISGMLRRPLSEKKAAEAPKESKAPEKPETKAPIETQPEAKPSAPKSKTKKKIEPKKPFDVSSVKMESPQAVDDNPAKQGPADDLGKRAAELDSKHKELDEKVRLQQKKVDANEPGARTTLLQLRQERAGILAEKKTLAEKMRQSAPTP